MLTEYRWREKLFFYSALIGHLVGRTLLQALGRVGLLVFFLDGRYFSQRAGALAGDDRA